LALAFGRKFRSLDIKPLWNISFNFSDSLHPISPQDSPSPHSSHRLREKALPPKSPIHLTPGPPSLDSAEFALTSGEEVVRQQLNVRAYWAQKAARSVASPDEDRPRSSEAFPARWQLTQGVDLREWQSACVDQWMTGNGKGVIKVVTGAGKTVLALALAERLQNEREPDLRVVVVVPTVVLMEQWRSVLIGKSNLPPSAIGCLGGGNTDNFDDKICILVAVLNSAATKLPQIGKSLQHPLLLVVDECHRSGARQMSKIYETPRSYSLGLSATPERDELPDPGDDEESETWVVEEFDESVLGRELGPILFELDYRGAIERGILSPFLLKHYGLPLDPLERSQYEKLSREITELRKSLQARVSGRAMDGGALVGWARRVAGRGNSALAEQASRYVRATGQRKLLVYHAKARAAAVKELVGKSIAEGSKVVLFHESIAEVMQLFAQLALAGHQVVVEHSQLPDSLRQESIRLFRDGNAQVLISARSLIEGFDVPSADVGIVVASSSSVRQRIQTLGRILRKKPGHEDRTAVLHVLYMADTTDEMIYGKEDWEKFTGAERNQYFVWDPLAEDSQPLPKDAPPRRPKPREGQIDWTSLHSGDEYPGDYEGFEFAADSQGNIRTSNGEMVANPQNVPSLISGLRGNFGRFRVTPERRAILLPVGDGRLVFGGFLAEPFEAHTAMPPPAPGGELIDLEVRSKADGPRIMLRITGGELYARRTDTATDPIRGRDAEKLAGALTSLQRAKNIQIRRIKLSPDLEVFAEIAGQRELICRLNSGLEFKDTNLP
jgi:superfamily II DNA or RNA helicase